ncbi:MAG: CHAP domain-containing protein [Flavobacteriales bacterium]|nr:CHAP domain-containing protein [Flavobacteriales bacterium]
MRELKGYKEELAAIGLLSIVLLLIRWVSSTIWPTTGQYDLAAQTETVFFVVLRLVIYILAACLGLRIVSPKAYTHLKHRLLDRFDTLPEEKKDSYSLRIFAVIFFGLIGLAVAGSPVAPTSSFVRTCIVDAAMSDVGVREATGRNDGPAVERYLAHVGLGKGNPWCAAFVSYHLDGCGVKNPRSAWSPAFATAADRVWTPRKASRSPLPGDVFSIYYPNLKRVGHVGFVRGIEGKYLLTIEGNTSGPGSREGDGVYARKRELAKIHAITSYTSPAPRNSGATRTGSIRNGRLQTQTAARKYRDHQLRGAEGARRYTARLERDSAWCARGGKHSLATAWSGHTHRDSAQRSRLEFGGRDQRPHSPLRWLRLCLVRGQALRSMESRAQLQGQHGGRSAGDREGSALHAEVGVVVTAPRYRWSREAAVADRGQGPQVPQTPVLA